MIKATSDYHRWEEVPYETQLRLVRALAGVAIECDELQATYIYLEHTNQKFNIHSIQECINKEIDAYEVFKTRKKAKANNE